MTDDRWACQDDLDGIWLMLVEPEGRAFFRDPDGNMLALMSEVPTA